MTVKYKIIRKDIVCHTMHEYEAHEMLMQLSDPNPDIEYEVVKYDFIPPEAKRMGRDPDLH